MAQLLNGERRKVNSKEYEIMSEQEGELEKRILGECRWISKRTLSQILDKAAEEFPTLSNHDLLDNQKAVNDSREEWFKKWFGAKKQ